MKQRQFKRTSTEQRKAILKLLNNGVSMEIIANSFKVNKSTVSRIRSRYINTNSYLDRPRQARKKKISTRTFRSAIRELSKKNYQSINIFRHILQSKYHVRYSKSGAYKLMKREGFRARIKKRKPLISKTNRFRRIIFARQHVNWSDQDWKRVVWTDETSFERIRKSGREYYYKECNDNISMNTRPSVQKGGGSSMFWGCFQYKNIGFGRFISGSVNAKVYQDILQHEGLDSVSLFQKKRDIIWMQDNAPPHKAKSTLDLINIFKWETMIWPPFSPDLNPIENLWQVIKNRVYSGSSFKSIEELQDAVEEIWYDLDQSEILINLIKSMPHRMREVIRRRGYPIDY